MSIQEGYKYAIEHQSEAVQILAQYLTDNDRNNVSVEKALAMSAPHFESAAIYGFMEPQRVSGFLHWLADQQLEHSDVVQQILFTNDLLG